MRAATIQLASSLSSRLSFALGACIELLGSSKYSEAWIPIEHSAVNPSSILEVSLKHSTNFPSPLGHIGMRNSLLPETFQTFVSALYEKHEETKFEYFSWLYWHASYSPDHIQGSQYGACFEHLLSAYFKSNSLSNKVIVLSNTK